jgi:hypothetical protein
VSDIETQMTVDKDGFWADKMPCWDIRGCPEAACRECEAYQDQSRPCWELDTLCKQHLGMRTCDTCEVYRLYGPAV